MNVGSFLRVDKHFAFVEFLRCLAKELLQNKLYAVNCWVDK
jgi:hypothetical protein